MEGDGGGGDGGGGDGEEGDGGDGDAFCTTSIQARIAEVVIS